jgi:hypothetical protein
MMKKLTKLFNEDAATQLGARSRGMFTAGGLDRMFA